jgi:hypothetical protein
LTNTGVDFTFSPNEAKDPQASAFWPLLNGGKDVVIQGARKREIDDQISQVQQLHYYRLPHVCGLCALYPQ